MRVDRELGRGKEPLYMRVAAVAIWLIVWELGARALGQEILLASPGRVLSVLWELMHERGFYMALLTSTGRIALGFALAFAVGCVLAVAAHVLPPVRALLRPVMVCVKSVPVASFVILALVWIRASYLSVFISFLMALPIFYSQVGLGLMSVDIKLLEMADVYGVGLGRRLRRLYLPRVKAPLRSACRLACGLCWKAGVAAEVIGLPPDSIGERLYDAKLYLNTAEVLAWTVVIVVISLACEKLIPGGGDK
ncbi:MAG: ABC transporter permease [Candidatus Fimadaptatus sp.]|jgi:NitT/TauT family transport system permease protein